MKKEMHIIMRVLLLTASVMLSAVPLHAADQAMLAWGEKDRQASVYDLYFSTLEDGEWSTPQVMSDSSLPDILPTLGANSRGDVWLVWTQLKNVSGKLKFRRKVKGSWQEIETFTTGFKTNMAPTLVVDHRDVPWLAWSGVRNQDEDIYFSRWQGTQWTKPTLVHPENNVPDILPELSLSPEGNPRISWTGYNGEEYVKFLREWNGREWKSIRDKKLFLQLGTQKNMQQDSAKANLPAFMIDLSQASILVKGNAGSIRIREQR